MFQMLFFLKTSLFSFADVWGMPLALCIIFLLSRAYINKLDANGQKYLKQGLWLRVVMIFLFTAIMQFYYNSGDSYRYYVSIMDMRLAISEGAISYWDLLGMERSMPGDLLYPYFEFDELGENHYYMMSAPNFTVPKVGALLSYPFAGSYLAIALIFSFYSLLGSLEIYKVFSGIFPGLKRHIAIACFLIPSVAFWSSGILKDSLTFGATGFLFGAAYNFMEKRKNLLRSFLGAVLAVYLLFTIKAYILLALAPAIVVYTFIRFASKISSPALRGILLVILLIAGVGVGFLLYQNLTSGSGLEKYNAEVLLESIEQQRDVYESEAMQRRSGSNFSLGSESPVFLLPLGLIAAYFRPFPWEAGSLIMLLNVIESLFCTILFLYALMKLGVIGLFRAAFSHPLISFCLIFSLLFGAAVGTSTGNFGSLVRYKIPGMPFFFLLFFTIFYVKGIRLPKWLNRLRFFQR